MWFTWFSYRFGAVNRVATKLRVGWDVLVVCVLLPPFPIPDSATRAFRGCKHEIELGPLPLAWLVFYARRILTEEVRPDK